jgi:hypothetical protein
MLHGPAARKLAVNGLARNVATNGSHRRSADARQEIGTELGGGGGQSAEKLNAPPAAILDRA